MMLVVNLRENTHLFCNGSINYFFLVVRNVNYYST